METTIRGYIGIMGYIHFFLSSLKAGVMCATGACLATELKNNAFKLGRWTAQELP